MEGTKDLASINTLDLPEAAEGSATPSSPAKSTTRTPALKKVGLTPVTEAELFSFLFPEGLQHPSSASRLFLFARYGPLVHGQIVGGSYKRHRALTKQELNDLIEQDEREELLALFLDPSVKNSLTPEEAAGVIGETRALPHVKDALFNFTKHEVRAFLKYIRNVNDLDEGADIAFGILVNAIEAEHDYRIEQLKHAAAALVLKKKRGTPLQRGLLFKRIGMAPQHGGATAARLLKLSNVPLTTEEADLKALIERFGRCEGLVLPKDGAGKPGTVYKAMMASEADAAAVIKNLDNLKFYGQRLSVQHELVSLLLEMPHSRACEAEADHVGILVTSAACHDPKAGARLWTEWDENMRKAAARATRRQYQPLSDEEVEAAKRAANRTEFLHRNSPVLVSV